ncbi:TIGR03084 family metal-binding protein [Catellatospora sp. KI3]|uniref:TIGR03084 family metal-binding protein n=1 Tax=Catellatospora sp. KI3 TaxID=3041620 RepID=UPI002482DC99|nr:TIGR03084 family metal-binding protein [Catellatospora sp. KI3]MDI1464685.1 TIGR03084 family metal-binding protein [Catellatospora sp. KI3]
MAELAALLDDLAAEGQVVDRLLDGLPHAGWAAPTPAAGWTVAHQIAHLAWTDHQALLAVTDPPFFAAQMAELLAADPLGFVDTGARAWVRTEPAPLRTRWRQGRADLAAALGALPPGARIGWYGPPMSAASMATARIMETWAHGYDLADTLGVVPEPTDRLRHVAHLGVRTRDFAFQVHGLDAPTEEFAVELTGPDGQPWRWGPEGAAQRVTGPALDFCLLVTQRRHRADLAVTAAGHDADRWLDVAQAFAGPPGGGRAPGRETGGPR